MFRRDKNGLTNNSAEDKMLEDLLTPENCQSSTQIRTFLRLSRLATDDTIKQNLGQIKSTPQCDKYFKEHIVPQWQARDKVLNYCWKCAEDIRKTHEQGNRFEGENMSQQVDLREDPYARINYEDQMNKQYSERYMKNWIENEREVERIVKEKTKDTLNDKCYFSDWFREFKKATSPSDRF